MSAKFTCSMCTEKFEMTTNDEEAQNEYKKNFPEYADAPRVIVCDNCYKKAMEMMGKFK